MFFTKLAIHYYGLIAPINRAGMYFTIVFELAHSLIERLRKKD